MHLFAIAVCRNSSKLFCFDRCKKCKEISRQINWVLYFQNKTHKLLAIFENFCLNWRENAPITISWFQNKVIFFWITFRMILAFLLQNWPYYVKSIEKVESTFFSIKTWREVETQFAFFSFALFMRNSPMVLP